MTAFELMKRGIEHGARGAVIKCHVFPTAVMAKQINHIKAENDSMAKGASDFELFGGVTLNNAVGGINPYAVDAALRVGGKVVWLPTIDSENECSKNNRSDFVRCVEGNKITKELSVVLDLIKDYDAAIATSHISPREIFIVVEAAKSKGISKIIISHPESNLVGLTLEEQMKLVKDYGVMLERCYAQPIGGGIYRSNLEINYEAVKAIGPNNIIIATDAGQPQNLYWNESFQESIEYLEKRGIDQSSLDMMTKTNPRKMLGII
jgi:hypothetical protein